MKLNPTEVQKLNSLLDQAGVLSMLLLRPTPTATPMSREEAHLFFAERVSHAKKLIAMVREFEAQSLYPRQPRYFFGEVTDTYGGETNYNWVRHYKIKATTMRGALLKLNKHEGYGRLKKTLDSGELCAWDPVGKPVRMMLQDWDSDRHSHPRLVELS